MVETAGVAAPGSVAKTNDVADQRRRAIAAQQEWRAAPMRNRLRAVRAVRAELVQSPREWADEITKPGVRTVADSLAAEVLPTADACRYLERNAQRLLRERSLPRRDRPIWGRGLAVRVRREPIGVVLIIGAGNYPLMLAGVQMLQAVAAGNGVLVKPAPGCTAPMHRLAKALEDGGAPAGLVGVLDESPDAARQAIELGVGRVVLTGSAATGQKVLAQAAETLTPCTMELSGCDAVFVLPSADLDRVAAALVFGLRLNGSATCIGPRRVFATADQADAIAARLVKLLPSIPATVVPPAVAEQAERLVRDAIAMGATPIAGDPTFDAGGFAPIVLRSPRAESPLTKADLPNADLLEADLFAPVMSIVEVADTEQALEQSRRCPYALGAGVFGSSNEAEQLANRVEAGCVTVNDLVAPTADPRVAFGGWNRSGFGVTRGPDGLLAMTRPKTIVTQRASWLPHLDPPRPGLDRLVIGLLRLAHGGSLGERWRGLKDVIKANR